MQSLPHFPSTDSMHVMPEPTLSMSTITTFSTDLCRNTSRAVAPSPPAVRVQHYETSERWCRWRQPSLWHSMWLMPNPACKMAVLPFACQLHALHTLLADRAAAGFLVADSKLQQGGEGPYLRI